MSRIDWTALMRVGIGETGLAPDDFWRLTPFEFTAICGERPERTPLTRAALDTLMRRHPDHPKEEGHDG